MICAPSVVLEVGCHGSPNMGLFNVASQLYKTYNGFEIEKQ